MSITLGPLETKLRRATLWATEDNSGCCDIEKLIFDEDFYR